MPRKTAIERFNGKVNIQEDPNACWEWKDKVARNGYGQFYYEGKPRRAHRFIYEYTYGKLQKDICVRHTCDNRACVNLNHLIQGTRQENANDAVERGRYPKGDRSYKSKLKEADIPKIRQKYESGLKTQAELGREYGVSRKTIHSAIKRKSWKHIQ